MGVKTVLSQLEEANIVNITGISKSSSGSVLKKIQSVIVFGKKSNAELQSECIPLFGDHCRWFPRKVKAAVEISSTEFAGETFGLRYEGEIELPKLMNRWNVEKMIEENLKGSFKGELFFGKSSNMEIVKVVAQLEKTEVLKREILESPEFKQCMAEQRHQSLLAPVCTTVRHQAASMDKILLTIHTPKAWSKSPLMSLLDGVFKALLLGNVEGEKAFSGTQGITISQARADRVSEMITAKVWTPTREFLLRNMRLMGFARFLLPATVLRNPIEVAALKLTADHIPATCRIEPSLVRTFDNTTVQYQINDCEHVLLMDRSRQIPVAVTTRTVESHKKIVKILSGTTEVQMIPTTTGSLNVLFNGEQLTLPAVGEQLIKKNHEDKTILIVKHFNDAVFVHTPEQGLQVLSDGSMIEVIAPQVLKSRTVGLCGDMNGESSADLKTPQMCVRRPQLAALSFMLNKSGAEIGYKSCSGLPSTAKEEFTRETTKCPREVMVPSTQSLRLDEHVSAMNLSSGSTGGATKMPNLDYVLTGYDIFRGNPTSNDGLPDPGFRNQIFKATTAEGRKTADGRYEIPNGMFVRSCSGTCQMTFSSSLIAGTKSYKRELETKVSASGGIPSASFSASAEFKNIESTEKTHSTFHTMTEVNCCVYTAGIISYDYPEFTNNFKLGLDSLSEDYHERKYLDFIREFGTHYIRKANMGALYGEQSSISAESWKKMLKKGTKIEASAGYSGSFSVSASAMNNDQKEKAEEFQSERINSRIYSLGKHPPEDKEPTTWMSTVFEEPQPIGLTLEPLGEMHALAIYLKEKPKVMANLKRALTNYCEELRGEHSVTSCDRGGDVDPAFPGEYQEPATTGFFGIDYDTDT